MKPVTPPEFLYHGTSDRNIASIRDIGLIPGRRLYVALSIDLDTATVVGRRHGGRTVVYKVLARKLNDDRMQFPEVERQKYQFFISENGVYQIKAVPPSYLTIVQMQTL